MVPEKKVVLSGFEKTAILMNVLGKEKSFELMKSMDDDDIRRLLKIMGGMKKAPIVLINTVLREFLYKLSEFDEIYFDENLTEPTLVTAGLGEERAKQIFGTLTDRNFLEQYHLSSIDAIEPKLLSEYLTGEHPQTIAIVVAHLPIDKQVKVIRLLSDQLRTEVVARMTSLESLAPEKIVELNDVLKKELEPLATEQKAKLGGVTTVADLVNALDKRTMNSLLTRLEERDPIMAEEIRQYIFTFTEIVKIDDRGIQLILREVPNEKLLLALKSAPEEVREKVFSCMSQRASEMLREDLAALGPQKVSDVEAAQRDIVKIIRKLEEQGKLVIGIGENQEVIA